MSKEVIHTTSSTEEKLQKVLLERKALREAVGTGQVSELSSLDNALRVAGVRVKLDSNIESIEEKLLPFEVARKKQHLVQKATNYLAELADKQASIDKLTEYVHQGITKVEVLEKFSAELEALRNLPSEDLELSEGLQLLESLSAQETEEAPFLTEQKTEVEAGEPSKSSQIESEVQAFFENLQNYRYPFVTVLRVLLETGSISPAELQAIIGKVEISNFTKSFNKRLAPLNLKFTQTARNHSKSTYILQSALEQDIDKVITQLRDQLPPVTKDSDTEVVIPQDVAVVPLEQPETVLPEEKTEDRLEARLENRGVTKELISHFAAFLSIYDEAIKELYTVTDRVKLYKDVKEAVKATDGYFEHEELHLSDRLEDTRRNAVAVLLQVSEEGALLHDVFRNSDVTPYSYSIFLVQELESLLAETVEYETLSASDREAYGSRLVKYVHDYSQFPKDHFVKHITVLAKAEAPSLKQEQSGAAVTLKNKITAILTTEVTIEKSLEVTEEVDSTERVADEEDGFEVSDGVKELTEQETQDKETGEEEGLTKESKEDRMLSAIERAIQYAQDIGIEPTDERLISTTEILNGAGLGKLTETFEMKIRKDIPSFFKEIKRGYTVYRFGGIALLLLASMEPDTWSSFSANDKKKLGKLLRSRLSQ